MDCMQFWNDVFKHFIIFVSIPQAVWIACNLWKSFLLLLCISFNTASGMDCMQFFDFEGGMNHDQRFNTASGMDCMQCTGDKNDEHDGQFVSIPQAVWIACNKTIVNVLTGERIGFNTASGMDCMQWRKGSSIMKNNEMFQYRKRYGLHAIKFFLR